MTLPAVGASGRIEWTFTGPLASGWPGTVVFAVKLQRGAELDARLSATC